MNINVLSDGKKNIIKALVFIVIIMLVISVMHSSAHASWKEDEDGKRYELDDGENAIGFQEIDGFMYYFNEDGYLQTGKIYIEEQEAYYYADKNGVIQIGVIDTDDAFYITDDRGVIQTGFVEVEGKVYYFNKRAEQLFGWFEIDEDWYYAGEDGEIKTGFITVDGYRYYLEEDGKRVSDAVMDIDGVTYIFSSDGSVDENATLLYPVYQYISNRRAELGLPDIIIDTRLQACALIRATSLKDGFKGNGDSVEAMLGNRGIKGSGGYDFSYGGIADYSIDRLITDMSIDDRFRAAILDKDINISGIGIYTEGGINYFDIILVARE
ncbi:MAG: hypothetical protein IJ661_06670 [Lachnospiraceae bacterium]|nr:hypothetical protein [Lachnospiraceae bacterium]